MNDTMKYYSSDASVPSNIICEEPLCAFCKCDSKESRIHQLLVDLHANTDKYVV